MSGLVIFSVPLYKIFCSITGFQGFNDQSNTFEQNADISDSQLDLNVIFTSQVDNNLPNETTGTSVFNVLPPKIGPYLMKIECFCFLDQTILPKETVEFPVTFYIDPLILDDPEARRVKNVTLSYTFFEKKG